jgi:hypothetical protein
MLLGLSKGHVGWPGSGRDRPPSPALESGARAKDFLQVALGQYTLPELAVTLEIAAFLGCSLLSLVVRGVGRRLVYRMARFVSLSPGPLDQAAARLQRRGPLPVFVGLNPLASGPD